METGKVAIGHCKYTATDIKSDGNELVGSHILAIKHAAEHDAKHRRGVEQHRGRGHAHLAHTLVIKRVSGGEADNAKKRTGNKLFRTCLEQCQGTRCFSLTIASLATHERQDRSH